MRSLATVLFMLLGFASTASAELPRAAVVVSGDPSERLTRAATELEDTLIAKGEVTLPADPATRDALRGATGTPEDGLEALRGERRRLGLAETGDNATLDRIGEQLELTVLVVVSGADAPVARVYDVNQHRFFVGEAVLDEASRDATAAFVAARAAAAERRRVAPTPEAAAAAQQSAESTTPASPNPAQPVDQPQRRSFMARNWPFFVAGALLIGATTFFLVQRNNDDTTPPVIHIRPGGI